MAAKTPDYHNCYINTLLPYTHPAAMYTDTWLPAAARDMMSYVTVVERCHLLPASGYWEGKGKLSHVTK